jgi:sulfatase modifying factor 1
MTMSDHPVTIVSWYGAAAFCDYYGYRLPTEAQWEYAARGGYYNPYYRYPWGSDSIDCSLANCKTDEGFCNPLGLTSWPFTAPVGYYGPTGTYGLCDMSGNLWEWCQDWYDAGFYAVSPKSNPAGPETGTMRVLRGGAWDVHGDSCHVAGRCVADPLIRAQVSGFRACR